MTSELTLNLTSPPVCRKMDECQYLCRKLRLLAGPQCQHSIASWHRLGAPQETLSIHLKYWPDAAQTWSFTVRLRVSSPLDAMCLPVLVKTAFT